LTVNHSRKILVASFSYPPNKDGVSESAFSFAEGLASRGHEVVVTTGLPEQHDALPERKLRAHVERFDIRGGPLLRDGIQGESGRYIDFVRHGGFDALLAMCLDTWPVSLLLNHLPELGMRKVLFSHGFSAHHLYPHRRPPWGLVSWLRGLAFTASTFRYLRLFDSLVFLSQRRDLGRFLDHTIARWIRHPKIAIMPNSVDPAFFQTSALSFRDTFGVRQSNLFLCVANYSARKNQPLALKAFVQAALPNAALIFIGSESNHHSRGLEQAASRADLASGSAIYVLTAVSRSLTVAAFHEATTFVLPALEETQPIVLFEAMASKLPFITTPTGCVSEMPGGLFAATASEMANAMRSLTYDTGRREALAAAGRAFAEKHCSRERSVEQMEELLTVPA
jgi:glycosyltransferase involved in cell wall biosynthesis